MSHTSDHLDRHLRDTLVQINSPLASLSILDVETWGHDTNDLKSIVTTKFHQDAPFIKFDDDLINVTNQ